LGRRRMKEEDSMRQLFRVQEDAGEMQ
jgi:hypothetical protein